MMLLGGSLLSKPSGEYSLDLKRTGPVAGNVLAWALIVFESQDANLSFLRMNIYAQGDTLRLRSASTRFLRPAYLRWYPDKRLALPPLLTWDEPMATCWMVGAVSRQHAANGPLPLRVPGATGKDMPWLGVNLGRASGLTFVPSRDRLVVARDALEGYLEPRVPRVVWDRRA